MKSRSATRELEDIQRMDMAAEWVLLLREEPIRDEDIANWLKWCETDPRNQRAFERAQEVVNLTRTLPPEDIAPDLVAGRRPSRSASRRKPRRLLDWLGRSSAGKSARRSHTTHTIPQFALAFAATMLITAGLWAWHTGIPVPSQAVVSSAEPIHASLLPDGSRMELAAKTVVAVNYTPQLRSLELQNGEAYFSVAPNKQRPFIVAAGHVSVRAVGTAFNVRRSGDHVVVTVTKGSVDVYQSNAAGESAVPEHTVQVAAGGEVAWDSEPSSAVVAAVDPAVALAWREGRLQYAAEPLDAVIADINRYSKKPVLITDESVKKLRFTGTVLTNATDEWLHALPGNFAVRVQEQNGTIVIQAEHPAAKS